MLLNYYRDPNFGDALNPIIFHKLLPGFFDNDPTIEFSGIGSIIGLEMAKESKKRIIFSSGFAYGSLPKVDDSFEIVCVRGPLTANALGIDKSLGIIDGAALLRELKFPSPPKKYKFSFMPHWESELKYPWRKLCEAADINYLSPTDDSLKTIDAILQSEVVIAEAMHAAIVADTLRTPWIPVKAYRGINDFKWNDWTKSVDLEYKPHALRSMYEVNDFVLKVFKDKSKNKLPNALYKPIANTYTLFQDAFLTKSSIEQLLNVKKEKTHLSKENILNSKVDQLVEKLEYVKTKYGKRSSN
ncbi:MAG: polysaccharide pyruvyl transferase family protein [Chryseolinea sp.]